MCKSPRRHGDRDRAQQQADYCCQGQEPLRSVSCIHRSLAAVLLVAYANRLRQLVFDRLIKLGDGRLIPGNEKGIANSTAFVDQFGRRQVE